MLRSITYTYLTAEGEGGSERRKMFHEGSTTRNEKMGFSVAFDSLGHIATK